MKILKTKQVDGRLTLLVDEIPTLHEMRFVSRLHPDNLNVTMYFAVTEDGYAQFLVQDPSHEDGFGGAPFDITLVGERQVILVGPWIGLTHDIERAGFPPCVTANFTTRPKDYDREFTFIQAYLTKARAYNLVESK